MITDRISNSPAPVVTLMANSRLNNFIQENPHHGLGFSFDFQMPHSLSPKIFFFCSFSPLHSLLPKNPLTGVGLQSRSVWVLLLTVNTDGEKEREQMNAGGRGEGRN